jgi:hypothetical protein
LFFVFALNVEAQLSNPVKAGSVSNPNTVQPVNVNPYDTSNPYPTATPEGIGPAVSPSYVNPYRTSSVEDYENINSSKFKLLICDGPPLPSNVPLPKPDYVPCDFKGLMMQIQHFINIAMVLGVISAILLITWAGALYVSGQPKNIDQARAIFPVVVKGFIIMLLAWFIVYQILEWLTGSKSFGVLLGQ